MIFVRVHPKTYKATFGEVAFCGINTPFGQGMQHFF
jgi:hypothetical protein